jgi:hypothetical protein
MKKKLKFAAIAFVAIFALMQLANPERTNPPVKTDLIATLHPPDEIAAMLTASCYDCHSYETKWPWYSHIAPVAWLVANDVNGGRSHLNLSEWPIDDVKRAVHHLDEMSDQVGNSYMPPSKYTAIHSGARLTASQRKALTDWLDAQADKLNSGAK